MAGELMVGTPEFGEWQEAQRWESIDGAPEAICFPVAGACFGESGRYYPHPGLWDVFVNPRRPSLGQTAVGDPLEILLRVFLGSAAQAFATTVVHYVVKRVQGTPTFGAFAQHVAEGISAAFTSTAGGEHADALYRDTITFGPYIVRSLKDSTEESEPTSTFKGRRVNATGTVPLRSAVVVKKGTAKVGRSFQGRMYLAPFDETVQTAGSIDTGAIGDLQRTLGKLIEVGDPNNTTTGDAATMGVYSRTKSKDQPAPIVTPVTSLAPRGVYGSQRRRQHVE